MRARVHERCAGRVLAGHNFTPLFPFQHLSPILADMRAEYMQGARKRLRAHRVLAPHNSTFSPLQTSSADTSYDNLLVKLEVNRTVVSKMFTVLTHVVFSSSRVSMDRGIATFFATFYCFRT